MSSVESNRKEKHKGILLCSPTLLNFEELVMDSSASDDCRQRVLFSSGLEVASNEEQEVSTRILVLESPIRFLERHLTSRDDPHVLLEDWLAKSQKALRVFQRIRTATDILVTVEGITASREGFFTLLENRGIFDLGQPLVKAIGTGERVDPVVRLAARVLVESMPEIQRVYEEIVFSSSLGQAVNHAGLEPLGDSIERALAGIDELNARIEASEESRSDLESALLKSSRLEEGLRASLASTQGHVNALEAENAKLQRAFRKDIGEPPSSEGTTSSHLSAADPKAELELALLQIQRLQEELEDCYKKYLSVKKAPGFGESQVACLDQGQTRILKAVFNSPVKTIDLLR